MSETPLAVAGDSVARYTIGPVDAADAVNVEAFVALHEEAARWLWERGILQWKPGAYTAETVRGTLGAGGALYLARRDGVPAGGFTLQWADEEIWGEQVADAGYLHALCVRRADAGQGLSSALLDHACQRVAEAGRAWLRLDCYGGNPALRSFYEREGFTLRGLAGHSYPVALYERPASLNR